GPNRGAERPPRPPRGRLSRFVHGPPLPSRRTIGACPVTKEQTMKDKPESRRRVLHWAALSSVAALVWPRFAHAGASNGGEGLGARVAGTYLARVQHQGFPVALALITLTRDGAFISNETSDQGAGGLVTKEDRKSTRLNS